METIATSPVEHREDSFSPVYAMLRRPSLIDYPGHLCRVLFISGCNLRCFFCHNTDLTRPRDSYMDWKRLLEALDSSREYWVDSVCISGGEPTLHPKLTDLIKHIRKHGFRVKLDTNGTKPEVIEAVLPLLDYIAMDYKAPLARYAEISGCRSFDPDTISRSVELIKNSGCDYEFRTTVVESWHTEDDMRSICAELAGAKRYTLQAYVPPKDLPAEELSLTGRRTPMKVLKRYYEICLPYFPETVLRGA